MKWFGDMENKQLPTMLLTDYLNRGELNPTKAESGRCGITVFQWTSLHMFKRWVGGKAKGRDWVSACPARGVRWVSGSSPSVPHEQGLRAGGSGQSQSRRELCCKCSLPLSPGSSVGPLTHRRHFSNGLKVALPPFWLVHPPEWQWLSCS